jgi:hypothetical protein
MDMAQVVDLGGPELKPQYLKKKKRKKRKKIITNYEPISYKKIQWTLCGNCKIEGVLL